MVETHRIPIKPKTMIFCSEGAQKGGKVVILEAATFPTKGVSRQKIVSGGLGYQHLESEGNLRGEIFAPIRACGRGEEG